MAHAVKQAIKKALCGSGSESVIPSEEVAKLIKNGAFLLDVRTMMEAKKGMVRDSTSIPLLRLKRRLHELPHDKNILTFCGTGERAGKARDILEAAGFKAFNGGGYEGILKMVGPK